MRNNRQVMSPNRVSSRPQDSRGEDAQSGTKNRQDDSSEDEDRSSDSSPSSPAPSATSRSDGASSSSSSSDCSESDSSSSNSDSDSASPDEGKGSKRKRSSKKMRSSKKKKRSRSSRLDSPSVEVPKLTGADDYELWRTMIELKLKVQKLWSLVTEEVVLDNSCSSAKKRRWKERWLKAQAVIAGSLGPRLAGRYRRLLVSCDPVALFQEIEKE
ncbi:hypothetical protein PF010_g4691, partial [Phytophthora fragariae]